MPYETIRLDEADGIATVTFSRPDQRNALNYQMAQEVQDAIAQVRRRRVARVLVVTGAGEAFCAGGDLNELPSGARARATRPEEIRLWLREAIQGASLAIHSLEMPTLAIVNGVAAGAGMDIACACDLRVGSERTRFLTAYTRIGLFPGGGGTWLLPRLVGVPKALELIYTNEALGGAEALRIGLLNSLVPDAALQAKGQELAARMAAGPPLALRLAKLNVYQGLSMDFAPALELAAAAETITLTSEDHREGATALRERREPHFLGS